MKPTLLFLTLWMVCTVQSVAQFADDWISYNSQQFGKVKFDLYAKRGSWGMGQQFYGANCYNGTSYKVRMEGEIYAQLVCGNEVSSSFSFTVDPYFEFRRVNPDSKGTGYLADNSGLLSSADDNVCKGNEINVKHMWGNEEKWGKTHARIHALGIRKLKLTAIYSDGTEVAINTNGDIIDTGNRTTPQPTSAPRQTYNSQPTNTQPTHNPSPYTTNNPSTNDEEIRRQQELQEYQRKQQQELREQQMERINEANRRTGEAWQSAFSTLGDIMDMIMQNSFRNSIQRENNQRREEFTRLQEQVSSKTGTLSNCTYCYGQGYNSCSSCSGSGKKTCMGCFGKGRTNCTLCYGTGTYLGNTCSACGGRGGSDCMICKGSGNSYCTSCHATGKEFCTYCSGTGQKFKESYTTYQAPAAPAPRNTPAPQYNVTPSVSSTGGANRFAIQSYNISATNNWLSEKYNDRQNNYCITNAFCNLAADKNEFGLVVSTNSNFQRQLLRRVPYAALKDTIQKYFNLNYHITAASGNANGEWLLVLSTGGAYERQQVFWRPDFPESEIKKYWDEGYKITTLASNNTTWFTVMSTGNDYTQQYWKKSDTFPQDFIKEYWDKGYYLTEVTSKNGQWVVVMTKTNSISLQSWITNVAFPDDLVKEKMAAGYRITSVAKGPVWAIVLSKFR